MSAFVSLILFLPSPLFFLSWLLFFLSLLLFFLFLPLFFLSLLSFFLSSLLFLNCQPERSAAESKDPYPKSEARWPIQAFRWLEWGICL